MLKLEKVQSNQNVTAPPANGAARPSLMGLTQVKQHRKSDGAFWRNVLGNCSLLPAEKQCQCLRGLLAEK